MMMMGKLWIGNVCGSMFSVEFKSMNCGFLNIWIVLLFALTNFLGGN